MSKNIKFAFFGTPEFSKIILDELKEGGFVPEILITAPDKPKGRGLLLEKSEVKKWAEERHLKILEPKKLDDETFEKLSAEDWDLFIVAAYGKIIPQRFLDIPKRGSINVHPSLLPKYRGPSPLQAQILEDDKSVGTTIMLMDALMDHGPLLKQEKIPVEMPQPFIDFMKLMATESGRLLVSTINEYLSGQIEPQEQNHENATICKMIKKEDGLIDLGDDAYKNYLKFLALNPWPGTFFFLNKAGKDIRIKITKANFRDGEFLIEKIIPEGKKEMNYDDFKRNL
jgi:methionyl-tRNA formyltransferase